MTETGHCWKKHTNITPTHRGRVGEYYTSWRTRWSGGWRGEEPQQMRQNFILQTTKCVCTIGTQHKPSVWIIHIFMTKSIGLVQIWSYVVHRCRKTSKNVTASLKLHLKVFYSQCVDKPTRCNTSYEWSLLSINWLYMFRTITSPPSV